MVALPVGARPPFAGAAGLVDYLLGDLIASAWTRGFWRPEEPDPLWLPPTPLPLAGAIVIGYPEDEGPPPALERLPAQPPGPELALATTDAGGWPPWAGALRRRWSAARWSWIVDPAEEEP